MRNIDEEKFALKCEKCGFITKDRLKHKCDKCGSIINSIYKEIPIEKIKNISDDSTMRSLIDILPICKDDEYVELLDMIKTTPIHNIKYKNSTLTLKDETVLNTKTTKDRMAVVSLIQMINSGIKEFAVCSTGNSSSAFLYYSNLLNGKIKCHVFGDAKRIHRVRYENLYSENHPINGDYVEAGEIAKEYAKEHNIFWEGGFFNYARREGLRTAYIEAFKQMNFDVDVVFQMVSSGMGILGGYKAANEMLKAGLLKKMPKFICVQQDTCMPMVTAYNEGMDYIDKSIIIKDPTGLAEAILRGDPTGCYPYLLDMVKKTNGSFEVVTQEELMEGRKELLELGINAGYEAAGSYMASKKLVENGFIKENEKALVMLTGTLTNKEDKK